MLLWTLCDLICHLHHLTVADLMVIDHLHHLMVCTQTDRHLYRLTVKVIINQTICVALILRLRMTWMTTA